MYIPHHSKAFLVQTCLWSKVAFWLEPNICARGVQYFNILHFCVHTAAFDRAFQLKFCRHFHKGPRLAAYILQFLLHICHFVCKLSKPYVNFPFRTKSSDIARALKVVPSCYPGWENMEYLE